MNPQMITVELEQNRQRLEYYSKLNKKSAAVEKWIEIYSERVGKLERKMSRQGLKTKLGVTAAKARSA
jgi:hypothetical protein